MVCLSHYEDFPIYEPAEGGYYYAGRGLVYSEPMSLRKAKAEINRLKAELAPYGWKVVKNWKGDKSLRLDPGEALVTKGRYIGEGEMWCIERKQGCHEKGRVAYY